ncbi:hypothetical protein G6F37_009803 [Rhizopus arrhizus]|nr:hypothetical protein G6F38_010621 [Rhizopus arrhizus]KAG1154051.1 hypothetical protein G6F37_009803 [Rhizopus arrhizus]
MKLEYVLAIFLCIINLTYAKKCSLHIEKSKLKTSGGHFRIHGRISTGDHHCQPTAKDDTDITTTIQLISKNSLSFKDAKGTKHSGKKCTIVASWYNDSNTFRHSGKKKEVYVPIHLVKSIVCNKDTKTRHTKTTKKSKTNKKTTKKTTKKTSFNGYNGKATFFTPNQGACGEWNDNNDMIAALSGELYGSYSKKSNVCGKKALVTNKANGESVKVTIMDACESCDKTHIDLSPAAFGKIGKFKTGVLNVEWHFL